MVHCGAKQFVGLLEYGLSRILRFQPDHLERDRMVTRLQKNIPGSISEYYRQFFAVYNARSRSRRDIKPKDLLATTIPLSLSPCLLLNKMLSLSLVALALSVVVKADSWGAAYSLGPTSSAIIEASTTFTPGTPPTNPKESVFHSLLYVALLMIF